ncbi:YeeE/YedE family protein [Palleronia caenipelagi]|uniref:YeeE/YedE family protein n=1 Tax=Palleronia caenipelagi TaxID=2489174 RepID=A0A547Q7S2_9RHOB|nr:YeeE/YedE family protein [Palleronia caenipelagi]TRD22432.1 YeeE/YedE family protein [Palleronia caenipelagi]
MDLGVETAFTPWASLFGGVLLGISSVMVMALFGRIAGIIGITSGAMNRASDQDWRWAFVAGMVLAPLGYSAVVGWPEQTVSGNLPAMVVAGLLVGAGTIMGSGCTSGHGICGLARLSPRSLAAVLTFMVAGFVTVFLLRHVF